ncbi:copper resistance CopC family protein [Actinoplanes sp. URMC 104]|uniref:copper resistance CopC family protein n=1 Tax=Actinoplanes sp. URMC 104 TaxID=3423409 RepID=UPI003F1E44C1
MRRLAAACFALALALALAPATPAQAHAELVSASPAQGAALATAPAAVTLRFTEKLNPDFTTIVVSNAARQRIPASPPAVHDADGTITLEGLLPSGAYTVAYRVVSVDGHTVQGSYDFTVGAAAPPAAAGTRGGVPAGVLVAVGVLAVLLAAAGLTLSVSGRRRAAALTPAAPPTRPARPDPPA